MATRMNPDRVRAPALMTCEIYIILCIPGHLNYGTGSGRHVTQSAGSVCSHPSRPPPVNKPRCLPMDRRNNTLMSRFGRTPGIDCRWQYRPEGGVRPGMTIRVPENATGYASYPVLFTGTPGPTPATCPTERWPGSSDRNCVLALMPDKKSPIVPGRWRCPAPGA